MPTLNVPRLWGRWEVEQISTKCSVTNTLIDQEVRNVRFPSNCHDNIKKLSCLFHGFVTVYQHNRKLSHPNQGL